MSQNQLQPEQWKCSCCRCFIIESQILSSEILFLIIYFYGVQVYLILKYGPYIQQPYEINSFIHSQNWSVEFLGFSIYENTVINDDFIYSYSIFMTFIYIYFLYNTTQYFPYHDEQRSSYLTFCIFLTHHDSIS